MTLKQGEPFLLVLDEQFFYKDFYNRHLEQVARPAASKAIFNQMLNQLEFHCPGTKFRIKKNWAKRDFFFRSEKAHEIKIMNFFGTKRELFL